MKALFFDNDLFMGMKEIGSHPLPEYKMFIPKNMNLIDTQEDLSKMPSTLKFVFQMQDYGREFVVYQLKGVED